MKEGYKQTELGVIPEDWEIKKLRDCSLIPGKYGINAPAVEFSNDLPTYLRITDIDDDGNFISFNKVSVNDMESNNFLLENEDLVFARTGATVGKSYLHNSKLNGNLVYAGFLIMFRLNRAVLLPYYLRLFTQTEKYWNWVKTISMRSGQPGINSNEYCSLEIPIPPIEEQNAIANCLSTWDEAIEKQQKLIEAKEIRHKALMQKLLSGKKRLPGFTDEWKEYKFSDLIKEVKRKETWDDTKLYDLISVRRRSGGVFHRESLYGHQIEVKSLVKIKENDFLISKMQIVHGASSIVPKKFEDYYVSGSYIILNIKNDKILSPKYLNLYSKQKSFYYQTFVSSYGVHIEKMTFDFKTFLKMSAIIPTLNEQNRIVEIIDTSNQELEIEKQKVDQLKEQKKALMQKLLTGKVRLPLNN